MKKSTSVATIGVSVPDALSALKLELKGLKTITETQYKTGGSGMVTGFNKSIQEETNIQTLVQMQSSIMGRENHYNMAQARLSILVGSDFQCPIFKDNGQSVESLESDIALRIQVLNVKERKEELEALLKEAEQFLTKEDQFAMFQLKLSAKLGLNKD